MKKRALSLILALTMIAVMAVVGIGAISIEPGLQPVSAQTNMTAAPFDKMPRTFDAVIHLPTTYADRAGVIVGNYWGGDACISFEINAGGLPRLYYQDEAKILRGSTRIPPQRHFDTL